MQTIPSCPALSRQEATPNRLIFISEKEKYLSFSDEPRLLEAVRKTNAKLIVLDPLSAYIGEETRINTANEIRRQFRPLIELAKEQRCAILIVHHMNKAIGQKAINRSVGSVDIIAAARSALLIGRTDKDRPDERILAQVKSNLAPTGNAIVFSVSDGKVEWLEETAKTADEVLGNVFAAVGRPDTQMQQAKDILSQLLADGPKAQREIIDRMLLAGVSEEYGKESQGAPCDTVGEAGSAVVLVFAVRRGWCEKGLCRRVGTSPFPRRSEAFRESRGNALPTTLYARCSGLHNKLAGRKNQRFFPGASAVVLRAA